MRIVRVGDGDGRGYAMRCQWGRDCPNDGVERHHWLFPDINDGRPVEGTAQVYCASCARLNIDSARTCGNELLIVPLDAASSLSVEVMCHALAMGGAR